MPSNTMTLPVDFTMKPRASTDTDARHLLADSVAPSESASMIDGYAPTEDGERTPRAGSLSRLPQESNSRFRIPAARADRRDTIADPTPRPYRGFPSEAHYLAALNAWANEKKFIQQNDSSLYGYYGTVTSEEYANRPKPEGLGLKKKWKARKEAREEAKASRRNTVT